MKEVDYIIKKTPFHCIWFLNVCVCDQKLCKRTVLSNKMRASSNLYKRAGYKLNLHNKPVFLFVCALYTRKNNSFIRGKKWEENSFHSHKHRTAKWNIPIVCELLEKCSLHSLFVNVKFSFSLDRWIFVLFFHW